MVELAKNFRDHAPLNATGAATIIVDGVKAERWRILVGKDGAYLDERVRAVPRRHIAQDFMSRFVRKYRLASLALNEMTLTLPGSSEDRDSRSSTMR